QEGTVAFANLVGVAAAIGRHVAAGLPYLVYLRNPTTGGVLATWGSLGQLTAAEPGALIGYHGPRVSAALTGAEFPAGVQTAENLHLHRLLDAVVPPAGLRALARRALDVMCPTPPGTAAADPATPATPQPAVTPPAATQPAVPRPGPPWPGAGPPGGPVAPELADVPAWQVVEWSRRPDRPGVAALLTAAGEQVTLLADPGPGLVLALARFGGAPCVLV